MPEQAITTNHASISNPHSIKIYSCEGGAFQIQNNCNTCAGLLSLREQGLLLVTLGQQQNLLSLREEPLLKY